VAGKKGKKSETMPWVPGKKGPLELPIPGEQLGYGGGPFFAVVL